MAAVIMSLSGDEQAAPGLESSSSNSGPPATTTTPFPTSGVPPPPGAQEEHIAAEPERFFRPPYVGHRGWIGVRLDRRVIWRQVEGVCEEAYRSVAPRKLLAALDDPGAPLT